MSTVLETELEISAHWRDILSVLPGYDPIATREECWWDEDCADNAVGFIETMLTHFRGEKGGTPFLLEKWQKAIVGCLFGWKRPNGKRRYRESLIYVPRKNGKSALCAAIILAIAFLDEEPGAELYSAAANSEQAAAVFDQAEAMVDQEPELAESCQVYRAVRKITRHGQWTYKAISSDAGKNHGKNVHAAIIDELHEQPNRDLVDAFQTSTGARKQSLIIYITTADYDRESICNEKRDYAIKIRDGILKDDKFFPVLYEASNSDDWTDPKVWAKANPNLGVSVELDYLQGECKKAQEIPSYQNTFKRLHLNIKTTSDVVWLPLEKWDLCGPTEDDVGFNFEDHWTLDRPCFVGLDLATTTDVAAAAFLFAPRDGEKWTVKMKFWIPADGARQRERRDRVPYETWARQGFVTMTDGNVIDYDVIRRDLNEMKKTHDIRKLAIDRWNASQITTQLMGDGFDVEGFGQGYVSMNAPTKELEKLVMSAGIQHGGNPVLRWMASNCMVEQDAAGNIKPSKRKSIEKIDGIVALIMALGIGLVEDTGRSIYETRGLTRIG